MVSFFLYVQLLVAAAAARAVLVVVVVASSTFEANTTAQNMPRTFRFLCQTHKTKASTTRRWRLVKFSLVWFFFCLFLLFLSMFLFLQQFGGSFAVSLPLAAAPPCRQRSGKTTLECRVDSSQVESSRVASPSPSSAASICCAACGAIVKLTDCSLGACIYSIVKC